jgi:hypothetical protein
MSHFALCLTMLATLTVLLIDNFHIDNLTLPTSITPISALFSAEKPTARLLLLQVEYAIGRDFSGSCTNRDVLDWLH